ncbi:hypothetical protein K438DRAFT_1246551 [Mycena galopus ATCC 62051]|nr:hypothetical protein K438DRAFT_1246551 [Mycena galopus ATCC 62051]
MQSCLNCHTSKRKCDRKCPCQRYIQLGLTGLCVCIRNRQPRAARRPFCRMTRARASKLVDRGCAAAGAREKTQRVPFHVREISDGRVTALEDAQTAGARAGDGGAVDVLLLQIK